MNVFRKPSEAESKSADTSLSPPDTVQARENGPSPEGSSPGSSERPVRLWNQPLTVGILVLVGTFVLQQWGWRAQQSFIARESRAGAKVAQAHSTTEQVTVAVGKRLTAYAIIVGAHEAKVKTTQLNETVDRYQALQLEWDQSEDLLKMRMQTWFSIPEIQSGWEGVLRELDDVDLEVKKLHAFNTPDSSDAHQAQIKNCRALITGIEQHLLQMNRAMVQYTDTALTPK